MWSDNETATDYLGFDHLVRAITAIVRNEALLPATIGVYGDWGSGKSSLLRMAQSELTDSDTLVLSFNGWLFEGYEDAKTALMGTILDGLSDNETLTASGRKRLAKLLRRVNWMRLLGMGGKAGLGLALAGPAGLGLAALSELPNLDQVLEKSKDIAKGAAGRLDDATEDDIRKFIKDDPGQAMRREVRGFRSDFAELLADTNLKRLVVIIDDLDRCLPDTIIETLEAIKLFLFVPHTAFVIGADERLVKYAVRKRFPELPGERAEVGRDYLEKLIQYPIRVPPLSHAEMETYINLLFADATSIDRARLEEARRAAVSCDKTTLLDVRFNVGIAKALFDPMPPDLEERMGLAQRLAPVLAAGRLNGNPRQCKRFLNALVMRDDMARSRGIELNQRVLAKLMLLEYFRSESFRRLSEIQAEQNGKPVELREAEVTMRASATTGKGRKTEKDDPGGSVESRLPAWLSDGWTIEWLKSEPLLEEHDLRPYFYFSRDLLGGLGGAVQRLSPIAQEIFGEIFQESQAIRKRAIEKATGLSEVDSAAVFEAIAARARSEDDSGKDGSAVNRAFDLVAAKPELYGQLLTLLEALPEQTLSFKFVPRLEQVKGPHEAQAKALIAKWSRSSANPQLRSAASTAQTRKKS